MNRLEGMGGSDMGAMLGLSTFKSAEDLFLEKTGQKPPDPTNLYMEVGTALEQVVLQRWAKRTGAELHGGIRYHHPDHPWLAARLDAEAVMPTGDWVVLEAKTCSFSKRDGGWGPEGSEMVPGAYYAQVQLQLLLSRLNGRKVSRAHLACMFLNRLADNEKMPQIFPIEFNPEMAEAIVARAVSFWERVTNYLSNERQAANG